MKLNKLRIGSFIKKYKEKCNIPDLTEDDVSGINRDKEFFEPSRQIGKDTSNYKIVPPGYFACNLMHVGRDKVLPISMNHTTKNKIVSPAYDVFYVDEKIILKEYFFMFLKSSEKDRFFWFNTDSSIRDGLEWDVFCNLEINVPSINIQKKYIKVFQGLNKILNNNLDNYYKIQTMYEYILDIVKKEKKENILNYIEERKEKNSNLSYKNLVGVGNKGFIDPRQQRDMDSLKKCKIFCYKDFVYNPSVLYAGAIALNTDTQCNQICTEEYIVFHVKDENVLIPEYLYILLKRKECGRYIDFMFVDSVRNRVYFEDLNLIEIPVPKIEIQQMLSNLYLSYHNREIIIEKLKKCINDICPVLIQGSIMEVNNEQ